MKPAGQLPVTDWMTRPDTVAVMTALAAEDGRPRFVGGAVRDTVLGLRVTDVDIATPDAPETVIAKLERAGLKAVPTGIDHGTVTAVAEGRGFEVTTLRRDVETHGRHATVEFTDDWLADAERRDFTMNAMYADPDGTLYDPFGGCDDAEHGRVRFVGDARRRIEEDHLRTFRFFRFHAHYGRGAFDAEGYAACKEHADRLAELSAERVWQELSRLLVAPAPAPVIEAMKAIGVLEHWLPEASGTARLGRLTKFDTAEDPVLRLACLIEGDGEAVARRLRLSRADHTRLTRIKAQAVPRVQGGEMSERAALYEFGPKTYADFVLYAWAADLMPDTADYIERLKRAAAWTPKTFPLSGEDAKDVGVEPGPEIGRLLHAVEDWWLAENFAPDRAACLAKLKEMAG
jgi:poly(A) polymerase